MKMTLVAFAALMLCACSPNPYKVIDLDKMEQVSHDCIAESLKNPNKLSTETPKIIEGCRDTAREVATVFSDHNGSYMVYLRNGKQAYEQPKENKE